MLSNLASNTRKRAASAAFIVVILLMTGCATDTETSPQTGPEFVPIFNGEDLSGWHIDRVEADSARMPFMVENGQIILDTEGTEDFYWLTYDKELTDFELRLEFMAFKGEQGNCGIQFRDTYGEDGYMRHGFDLASNVPESTGFIWDFTEWWLPYPLDGYNSSLFEPYLPEDWTYKWSTDDDPWNTFEVSVIGSRVKSVLNGKTIIDWDGGETIRPTGSIAIEVHRNQDFRFRFKDIELADLSE